MREVWFIHDDELEYIARATRDPEAVARNKATAVLRQPVILSLLIDTRGFVQGYRVFTDPHAEPDLRLGAFRVAIAFKARFGRDGWECTDFPPAEGETPIMGTLVKERCRKVAEGTRTVIDSRHYYKPGQAYLDPRSQGQMINAFESSASVERVRVEALPQ